MTVLTQAILGQWKIVLWCVGQCSDHVKHHRSWTSSNIQGSHWEFAFFIWGVKGLDLSVSGRHTCPIRTHAQIQDSAVSIAQGEAIADAGNATPCDDARPWNPEFVQWNQRDYLGRCNRAEDIDFRRCEAGFNIQRFEASGGSSRPIGRSSDRWAEKPEQNCIKARCCRRILQIESRKNPSRHIVPSSKNSGSWMGQERSWKRYGQEQTWKG